MTRQEAFEILRDTPIDIRSSREDDIHTLYATAQNMALDALVGGWIPCSERLPENEQEVEITYVSKYWKTGEPLYLTCRAFYTDGTMTTEDSNYVWNEIDNWEYNENFDAYIIPEGWWEGVSFAEEFYPVDKPVIAWMPLPEPWKGE